MKFVHHEAQARPGAHLRIADVPSSRIEQSYPSHFKSQPSRHTKDELQFAHSADEIVSLPRSAESYHGAARRVRALVANSGRDAERDAKRAVSAQKGARCKFLQ
jgi:hypothetical protein